ncbi:MAG: hypothetical protein AAF220_04055 [Pseudomonadota bacterium]
MKRIVLPLALLLPLTGCPTAGVILAGASVTSYVNTDKFLEDHVADAITEKDCRATYVLDGEEYCQDPEDPVADARAELEMQPHCYRSLGQVTCYDRADPYNNNERPVR